MEVASERKHGSPGDGNEGWPVAVSAKWEGNRVYKRHS